MKTSFLLVAALALFVNSANGGPVAYGLCQAGCSAPTVACYSAAGAVFGTVTVGVGTPAAILACNGAFGTCCATCASVALFAPTP
ncbi:hypothetical protein JCM6882_003936 [Rhodosporidiobolus microsporus]